MMRHVPAGDHNDNPGESGAVLSGSTGYLVATVLASPSLAKSTVVLVATIARRFFIDQFIYKLRPGSVPLRNVEHRLDEGIPVRYESVGLYLTFVRLWISALSFFRKRLGSGFNPDIVEFLSGLRQCYSDASTVYARCLSTTRRPDRAPCPRLAFVYTVDPHLFCVPSLHVLVVCYTYKKIEGLLRSHGLDTEYASELREIRARALAITESILYVRQHSVNCIPTALAMLSVILPAYDGAEARSFLSGLFAGDDGVPAELRAEAVAYMLELYDSLVSRGTGAEARYGAIVDFLLSYDELYPAKAGDTGFSGAPVQV